MSQDRQRLRALEDAYFQGIKTVEHDGQSVTYRSLQEMEHLITKLKKRISGNTGSNYEAPSYDRGYQ